MDSSLTPRSRKLREERLAQSRQRYGRAGREEFGLRLSAVRRAERERANGMGAGAQGGEEVSRQVSLEVGLTAPHNDAPERARTGPGPDRSSPRLSGRMDRSRTGRGGEPRDRRASWCCVQQERSVDGSQKSREEMRLFVTEADMEGHVNRRLPVGPGSSLCHIVKSNSFCLTAEEQEQMRIAGRSAEQSILRSPLTDSCMMSGGSVFPPVHDEKGYSGPYCRLFPDVVPQTAGQFGDCAMCINALNAMLDGQHAENLMKREQFEDALLALGAMCADEPSCVTIRTGPEHPALTVVGDVHGQKGDLLGGILGPFLKGEREPPQLLFLGDYVDRGPDSMDVLAIVALLKLCFPRRVHLLRGNHEDPQVNHVYGFFHECERRFPLKQGSVGLHSVWVHANAAFSKLPAAAVVEHDTGRRFFACHGGLCPAIMPPSEEIDISGGEEDDDAPPDFPPPAADAGVKEGEDGTKAEGEDDGKKEDSPRGSDSPRDGATPNESGPAEDEEEPPKVEEMINKIDRFLYGGVDMSEDTRPPKATKAVMDGLLWSDPLDEPGGKCFQQSARGCGWKWSSLATQIFCEHNDFDFVCRSHQCVMAGREWHHGRLVLTIFSAANYCGVQHNRGAVLHVTKDWDITAVEYEAAAAPAPSMDVALPKYFAPVMEPVQFPECEGGYEALCAELTRLKQTAVAETKFSDAAKLKRQLSALLLTNEGGAWVYSDDTGMTAADQYHFHFRLDGRTVIGNCTDQGNDCQNRIEVGVNGDSELIMKEEENTYECTLSKDHASVSGSWHATDGTSGDFSLQRLRDSAAVGDA